MENSRLQQIAVELVAGRSGKRWKQVGVYKVSRECPVTRRHKQFTDVLYTTHILNFAILIYFPYFINIIIHNINSFGLGPLFSNLIKIKSVN